MPPDAQAISTRAQAELNAGIATGGDRPWLTSECELQGRSAAWMGFLPCDTIQNAPAKLQTAKVAEGGHAAQSWFGNWFRRRISCRHTLPVLFTICRCHHCRDFWEADHALAVRAMKTTMSQGGIL